MDVMADWSLASTVSRGVAKLAPAGDPAPFQALEGPNAESVRLVSAYTGLEPESPLPGPESVGREEWIDANLSSMRGVLEPVAGKLGGGSGLLGGIVGSAAGGLLAIEAGAISGFLAGRVLGQYEFPVLDPAAPSRLLFLSPNLARAAESMEADTDELLRWVALHETTHALQFGGVPWLRGHLAGIVEEFLGGLEVDPARLLRLPDLTDLRGLVDSVREDGFAALGLSPERRVLLERAQAFMALLEGYAEHVMDAVGASLLPNLPKLR